MTIHAGQVEHLFPGDTWAFPGYSSRPMGSGDRIIYTHVDMDGGTSRKGSLCTLRRGRRVSRASERSEATLGYPLVVVPGIIAGEIDVLPAQRRDVLDQRPRKTLGFETPASKLQASVASTG